MKEIKSFDENEKINIGKRIYELRKNKGYKGAEMAKFMDIHRSTYSDIECGKVKLSTDNLYKLCQIFEVSSDYILLGNVVDNAMVEIQNIVKRKNPEKVIKILEGIKLLIE